MTATAHIDYQSIPLPHAPGLRSIDGTIGDPGTLRNDGATATVHSIVTGAQVVPAVDVELYRRRRFIVGLALSACLLIVAQFAGLSLTGFGDSSAALVGAAESQPIVHVVLPGETYAGIAASLGADEPVAAAERLASANGNATLQTGERLVVDRTLLGS